MSSLPLFYKKVVPVNKEQHSKLYIEPVESYGFTSDTNSLYIAAVEFGPAAREYPIVFGGDAEGTVFPMALLGLRNNQNLFVNKKGEWGATYIPAYARRYPFILATPDGDSEKFTVCIDEDFAGFNTRKKGQQLFDKDGEQNQIWFRASGCSSNCSRDAP